MNTVQLHSDSNLNSDQQSSAAASIGTAGNLHLEHNLGSTEPKLVGNLIYIRKQAFSLLQGLKQDLALAPDQLKVKLETMPWLASVLETHYESEVASKASFQVEEERLRQELSAKQAVQQKHQAELVETDSLLKTIELAIWNPSFWKQLSLGGFSQAFKQYPCLEKHYQEFLATASASSQAVEMPARGLNGFLIKIDLMRHPIVQEYLNYSKQQLVDLKKEKIKLTDCVTEEAARIEQISKTLTKERSPYPDLLQALARDIKSDLSEVGKSSYPTLNQLVEESLFCMERLNTFSDTIKTISALKRLSTILEFPILPELIEAHEKFIEANKIRKSLKREETKNPQRQQQLSEHLKVCTSGSVYNQITGTLRELQERLTKIESKDLPRADSKARALYEDFRAIKKLDNERRTLVQLPEIREAVGQIATELLGEKLGQIALNCDQNYLRSLVQSLTESQQVVAEVLHQQVSRWTNSGSLQRISLYEVKPIIASGKQIMLFEGTYGYNVYCTKGESANFSYETFDWNNSMAYSNGARQIGDSSVLIPSLFASDYRRGDSLSFGRPYRGSLTNKETFWAPVPEGTNVKAITFALNSFSDCARWSGSYLSGCDRFTGSMSVQAKVLDQNSNFEMY
jgi:hypothetical protein